MIIDDPLGAIHTAVANFNGVTVGRFYEACDLWECVYPLKRGICVRC